MEQVALLYTDIEGSTQLAEKSPGGYVANLRQHHEALRREAEKAGGRDCLDTGDGLGFAFSSVRAAAECALAIQAALEAVQWSDPQAALTVRIGLHWMPAEFREGQYRGTGIHLLSRLLSAGHGGQILASGVFVDQLGKTPRARATLLGTYRLRGFQGAEAIFQLDSADHSRSFPLLRAEHARRHNLPASPGKFFGRETELAAIAQAFTDAGRRLLTLTGPGGSGKSRLALAAGERLLGPFDHGVYFVPLADVTEAETIPQAIATALDNHSMALADPLARIRQILKGERTLFILDNFEQFSAGGAAVLSQLLETLEGAAFLVTSRARIGLPVEFEIPLAPFPLPAAGERRAEVLRELAGVQFFIEAIRRVNPDRSFTDEELVEAGAICRLLDGLPLALELVAARIHTLTLGELREQLTEGMGAGDPDARERLNRTLEWSLQLLPPPAARLLEALSIFRGGWSIQSAAAVMDWTETLTRSYLHYLLVCSLIQSREQAGQMRFQMLVPLREFAESRLGNRKPSLYRNYVRYFFDLMDRSYAQSGSETRSRLQLIVQSEAENILTALQRERSPNKRAVAAVTAQILLRHQAINRALRSILVQSISRARKVHPYHRAIFWYSVGCLDQHFGHYEDAYRYLRRAAKVMGKSSRRRDVLAVKLAMANTAKRLGKSVNLLELHLEALEVFKIEGMPEDLPMMLHNVGRDYLEQGDYREARCYFEECIAAAQANHSYWDLAAGYCGMGEVWIELGGIEEAVSCLLECVQLECQLQKQLDIPCSLYALAKAALLQGRIEASAVIFGIAKNQCERLQLQLPPFYVKYAESIHQMLRTSLGDAEWEESLSRGANLPENEWLDYLRRDFSIKNVQEGETHSYK